MYIHIYIYIYLYIYIYIQRARAHAHAVGAEGVGGTALALVADAEVARQAHAVADGDRARRRRRELGTHTSHITHASHAQTAHTHTTHIKRHIHHIKPPRITNNICTYNTSEVSCHTSSLQKSHTRRPEIHSNAQHSNKTINPPQKTDKAIVTAAWAGGEKLVGSQHLHDMLMEFLESKI